MHVLKLTRGSQTITLNDGTNYELAYEGLKIDSPELKIPEGDKRRIEIELNIQGTGQADLLKKIRDLEEFFLSLDTSFEDGRLHYRWSEGVGTAPIFGRGEIRFRILQGGTKLLRGFPNNDWQKER